ncbi:MAG: glycosyltransferase family 2 protein [Lachnospiraceae bacterium]|nr:glycosyltransferase family 2 protein [Lachnospiraceae bacterium]
MISILMATYNGEKYLREQLDSILTQTEQNRILYVRDDGSTDKTLEIIHEYAMKYPGMIIPVHDDLGSQGCIRNFMAMLNYAQSDYYMFCDQDDIWMPDKVERTLKAMKAAETECGAASAVKNKACKDVLPVCVHTDLQVVDESGAQVHPSFVEKLGLDAEGATFASLIYSNAVTGCTMMINQAMKKLLDEVPESCMMHDQWIGLLAEGCGKRVYLPETTICYRQHGDNVMGAKGRSFVDKLGKILNIGGYLKGIERTRALRERQYRQLEDLYELHRESLKPEAKKTAANLLNIKRLSGSERVKLLEEGGYLPKDNYEARTVKMYYRWWLK